MPDRELRFNELKKLFLHYGCNFSFNKKTQYITISRGLGADHRYWKVHSHTGEKDSFEARVVTAARRRLGFGDIPDEQFYAPL